MCGWLGKLKDRIRRTCRLLSPKVLSLSTWSADVNICFLWTKQLCCYYQNMFICLMLYLPICCLVTQACPPLCDPMDCSTPGFHVLHYLLELAQTHVHWVSNAIQPAHPLLSLLLLLSIFPRIRVFSSESALHIRWPKYWTSASASVHSMNIQGWFPLGLTCLVSLQSNGLSKVFPSSMIWKHQLLSLLSGPALTSVHEEPQLWLYEPLSIKWMSLHSNTCLGLL